MAKNIFLWALAVLMCVLVPSAYAGKVELTTYYPAPTGEYTNLETTNLTSKGDTQLATTAGNVDVGSAANPASLTVNNTLTFAPVIGAAADQVGGSEGSMRYSSNAGGTGVGGFLYRNNSGWVPLDSGGGGCYISYTGSCLSGFINKGSAGKWGACNNGGIWIDRPAGATCPVTTTSYDYGEAFVCCQS